MADPQSPLLTLDTLIERPSIAIDGALFALRTPDDLSLVEHHRYARLAGRLDVLMQRAIQAPEDAETERELTATLDQMGRIVLDAPDVVHARLKDTHRLAIVTAFTTLLRAPLTPLLAGATTTPVGASTGTK